MATYRIIKMKFLTPVHMGGGKETYDISSPEAHSDTLVSALTAMRAWRGQTEDLKEFMSSFRLSSAFPYSGQSYFLPKPKGKTDMRIRGKEEHEYRKKLKGVRFIERSVFAALARGESVEVEDAAIQDLFVTDTKDEWKRPYMNQVSQRVAVPADGGDAVPFFFDWRFFDDGAGLYCLTDANGGLYEEMLDLFRQLGEAGLGTDKSVGGGRFKVERGEMELPDVPDANAVMLLSLYLPAKEEMDELRLETSRYSLLLRGGYMAGSDVETFRHLWKKSVYMFDVGSIFSTTRHLEGKVADLSPDWNDERTHPVYRSGKPFCLPIKTN